MVYKNLLKLTKIGTRMVMNEKKRRYEWRFLSVFLTCKQVTYTMPWAIIALATFKKPATLAPLT